MRKLFWLLPFATLGLLLTACGGGSAPEPEPEAEPYTVSGTVEDDDGHAIEGVTISFNSDADDAITDSNGKWTSPELTGEVTVTPEHDEYTFEPEDHPVTQSSNSVDFTARKLFGLAGTILDTTDSQQVDPLEGAIVTLAFEDKEITTTTSADGTWTQEGLYGTVTVTPEKADYTFSPAPPEYSSASDTVDFTGQLPRCMEGSSDQRSNPCVIAYAKQLQMMRDDLSGHYALGADIEATMTANWNSGAGFEPIGHSEDDPFLGTLDGRGKSIDGLVINRPDEDNVGLFGILGAEEPEDPDDEPTFSRVEDIELTSIEVNRTGFAGGHVL